MHSQKDIRPKVLEIIKKNMNESEDNYVTFSTFEEFKKHLDGSVMKFAETSIM